MAQNDENGNHAAHTPADNPYSPARLDSGAPYDLDLLLAGAWAEGKKAANAELVEALEMVLQTFELDTRRIRECGPSKLEAHTNARAAIAKSKGD